MAYARARRAQVTNYWPGFVDALASLLLVIIFLLSLFMLTQFFLGREIAGKDTVLSRLNSQIAELTDLLQLERARAPTRLKNEIATLHRHARCVPQPQPRPVANPTGRHRR